MRCYGGSHLGTKGFKLYILLACFTDGPLPMEDKLGLSRINNPMKYLKCDLITQHIEFSIQFHLYLNSFVEPILKSIHLIREIEVLVSIPNHTNRTICERTSQKCLCVLEEN